jgi:hypothetical protein
MRLISATAALLILLTIVAYGPATGASAWSPTPEAAVERVIPHKEDSPEGESKDLPWVPILVLALVIPAAVLIVPSFFTGGGDSGGHGE